MGEAEHEFQKQRAMLEAELDMKKRKMLLRDFKLGTTVSQAHFNIIDMFGKKNYSERTCQRWFKKFRYGDFNLNEKPTDGSLRLTKLKLNKQSLEPVPLREEPNNPPQPPPPKSTPHMTLNNAEIERLIKQKSELTISKVFSTANVRPLPLQNNATTNRLAVQTIPPYKPPEQFKQLVPNGRAGLSVKVPTNVASKLTNPPALMERHSIGVGNRSFPVIANSQPITVQFQDLSPEQAMSTMRKVPERTQPAPANSNKRASLPTSTALASLKGVIYLNPQEIFKPHFGGLNKPLLQKPADTTKVCAKVVNTQRTVMPTLPPPQRLPAPINIDDSDSDDDIIFPEDISIPPPKIKVFAETFATYWDMESGTPILLNPTEEPEPPSPAVIEID